MSVDLVAMPEAIVDFIGTHLIGIIVQQAGTPTQIARFKQISSRLHDRTRATYQEDLEQAASSYFAQSLDRED